MNVHILTGSRGGIGKTMCSCSAAWAFSPQNKIYPLHCPTIVLDLNWTNPDSSRILNLGSEARSIGDFDVWKPNTALTVARWKNPDALPDGVEDFWGRLLKGIAIDSHDAAIVDTCISPLNLLYLDDQELDNICKLVPKSVNLYLWLVWARGSLYTEGLRYKLGNPLANIDKACKRVAEKLGIDITPIYVINPHILFEAPDILQLFRPHHQSTVAGLSDLVKLNLCPLISFDDFDLLVRTSFQSATIKSRNMFITFRNAILKKYNGRPKNIFALSYHCGLAADFPANVLSAHPTDIDNVVESFRPIAQDIAFYLAKL